MIGKAKQAFRVVDALRQAFSPWELAQLVLLLAHGKFLKNGPFGLVASPGANQPRPKQVKSIASQRSKARVAAFQNTLGGEIDGLNVTIDTPNTSYNASPNAMSGALNAYQAHKAHTVLPFARVSTWFKMLTSLARSVESLVAQKSGMKPDKAPSKTLRNLAVCERSSSKTKGNLVNSSYKHKGPYSPVYPCHNFARIGPSLSSSAQINLKPSCTNVGPSVRILGLRKALSSVYAEACFDFKNTVHDWLQKHC